ncbi:MAG: sugar ABC transporter [Mesorhizobium amorphae]|nr:MAG: sugar ABC transporter [Mesorhizobium amorphae]
MLADAGVTAVGERALFELSGIGKRYGNTRANEDVSLVIRAGEVLGLVGANGAGKSTLMRILCGVAVPTEGTARLLGEPLDFLAYSPNVAHERGIRIVWQELSLAPNLSVAENFFVEQPGAAGVSPFWLSRYHRLAREGLERIFPGAHIPTGKTVGELSLAERQMVEIARAASAPDLKLLILDEPTSSLGAERSAQLRAFVRALAAQGVAVIFISHKLAEVLGVSDRVVAMRNGRIAWVKETTATRIEDLVEAMGGASADARPPRTGAETDASHPVRVTVEGGRIALRGGSVVGLAGLEGSGQRALLEAVFRPAKGSGVTRNGQARFVSGDRAREGVFPLWSVLDNIAIARIACRAPLGLVSDKTERAEARTRAERLALDPKRLDSTITELSGGNQQKALVARVLDPEAEIVLLDDPTRGVDIAAKRDFYRVVRGLTDEGKLVLWHSTEDLEFLECDRVLVFAKGEIVAELEGEAISEEAVVAASFRQPATTKAGTERSHRAAGLAFLRLVPFVSLLGVFAAMAWLNPLVASSFGLELLLAPAVTLVLVALAQMFVVGGSEIDLGVGAFTGYVNVVAAVLLVASPLLGMGALFAGLVGYCLIGILIQARAIPAIVVTLGASFIWFGLGQTIQPSPGGESPAWLSALFTWTIPGIPTPLMLIIAAALVAFLLDRSPVGTVLRGFGSSPLALARSGWSPVRFAVVRYAIASLFGMTAGLYVTATNNASDVNAGASFTLLSVAAVVIGGCRLLGGFIAPLGVVAGAVTLSLIGALLASLGVSTDYNAAVQGGLLIVILGLQTLVMGRSRHG